MLFSEHRERDMRRNSWLGGVLLGLVLVSSDTQALHCVALITGSSGTHFWRAVESGARKAAGEMGVELFYRQPHDEAAHKEQRELIKEALQRGCQGLVLAPSSPAQADVVSAWLDKSLTVVLIDRQMNIGPVTAEVMTDNYAAGRLAAQKLALSLRNQGHVTVLRLKKGIPSTDAREQGFIDEVKRTRMTLIDPVYLGADINDIRKTAEHYLKLHGAELDGIFTPNEMTTVGVMAELRRSPHHGRIVHIGFDFNRFLLQALQKGEIAGLVLQQPFVMGYQGVKMAVKNTGPSSEHTHHTPVFYLTLKSLQEAEGKAFLQLNTDVGSAKLKAPSPEPGAQP